MALVFNNPPEDDISLNKETKLNDLHLSNIACNEPEGLETTDLNKSSWEMQFSFKSLLIIVWRAE